MRVAKVCLGCQIPVDKSAPRPYTRAKLPFLGSSYQCLLLADIREPANGARLDRLFLHASRHPLSLASRAVSQEAPTPDPRLTPPREEGYLPGPSWFCSSPP